MINAPIPKNKSALVVIDMQKCSVPWGTSNPDLVKNTRDMVDFAHANGIPVIYTKLHMRQDLKDRPICISTMNLSMDSLYPAPFAQEGNEDAELIPELTPEARDFVVIKRRTSAFTGTDLELYLRTMGITTLLMTGISTELGVEDTARNGRNLDFNIVILSDCCATTDPAIQEWIEQHIFPIIGRCMTSAEAQSLME